MISCRIGLYTAIIGHVPGVDTDDPERILSICWAFIFGGGWGMFLLSFVAGFAYDIEQQLEGAVKRMTQTNLNKADSNWNFLYKAGAVAALIAVVVFRKNFGAELMAFNGFGIFNVPEVEPVRALEWFALLQNNRFVGLALLGLIDIINYALVALIFLALYAALNNTSKSAMLVATVFGLIGVAVYLASNRAIDLLALSEQHAAAVDEAQQAMFLAAGEALLAAHNPGPIYPGMGMSISLLLVLLAGLIISLVMLRSPVFGKTTAIFGILANGIGLMYFIAMAFAPEIYWLPPTISAPFRIIWYVLIASKLFKLAQIEK